jgi:hypothetical protein
MLGNDADWRYSEVAQVFDSAVRQNSPHCFAYHVGHFGSEKFLELIGGLVRATRDGRCGPRGAPGGGFDDDGSSSGTDVAEELPGWMLEVAKVGKISLALPGTKIIGQGREL